MMDRNHISRRGYLILRAAEQGLGVLSAVEAVASTALAHPEWDMDEERALHEWEVEYRDFRIPNLA